MRYLLFLLLNLCAIRPSIAHPHSWIEQTTTFIGNSQQINALKMVWSFDAITTAYTIDGENMSAAHRHETLQKIGASIIAHMMPEHFFTYFYRDGQPIRFAMVHNYHVTMPHKKLILYFTIPLAKPLKLDGHPLKLLIFDRTYYVDMYWKNKQSIRLAASLKSHCSAQLIKPHPTSKQVNYAMSLPVDADPDYKLGQLFTQRFLLRCKP